MIKGILFDLDGTILETETSRFFAIKETLKKYDINFTKKLWNEKFKKFSTIKIFETLKTKYKKKFNLKKIYEEEIKSRKKYIKKNGLKYILGFEKFFCECKKKKIKTFVVSGGTQKHFEFVKKISNLKIKGIGIEKYKIRKPDPKGYLTGLKILNLKKEEVIIFDDGKFGIEAGIRAKIRTIAINYNPKDIKNKKVWKKFKDYKKIDYNFFN